MPEEKKRKKSSRANTQDGTNAKGASDSPTADKPAATEKTSSSAPPPQKKQSSRVNTQDEYDATGKGGSDNATVRPASTDDTSSETDLAETDSYWVATVTIISTCTLLSLS